MSRTETAALRTSDELADAIRDLSDANWVRLRKVAAIYARGRPIEADDLLQEAFRRVFDGGRHCPADVIVVRFLAEAMRSIAHGEMERGQKRPALMAIANHSYSEAAVDPPDSRPDPEQHLASGEDVAVVKAALLALFEDDPVGQVILEGMMEGMEGGELQDLTELDATAYQSKRRLIRRRMDKTFPEGWTP